jgi:hypothetical protein
MTGVIKVSHATLPNVKEEWKDVSEEVAKEIASIWESEYGGDWRRIVTKGPLSYFSSYSSTEGLVLAPSRLERETLGKKRNRV